MKMKDEQDKNNWLTEWLSCFKSSLFYYLFLKSLDMKLLRREELIYIFVSGVEVF